MKKSPLKELIFAYEPSDYAAVISGAWRRS